MYLFFDRQVAWEVTVTYFKVPYYSSIYLEWLRRLTNLRNILSQGWGLKPWSLEYGTGFLNSLRDIRVVSSALVWTSVRSFTIILTQFRNWKTAETDMTLFNFNSLFSWQEDNWNTPSTVLPSSPVTIFFFFLISEVFTAVKIHITVFGVVTRCSLVGRYRRFRRCILQPPSSVYLEAYVSLKRWHTVYNNTIRCRDWGNHNVAHWLIHKSLRLYLILRQLNAFRPPHHVSSRFAPILHYCTHIYT